MAIMNYDTAIRRRSDFFYYYLQRGRARQETGDYDAAKVDLEQSLEFLPTASAHLMLGEIAARRGNRDEAIAHFRIVAQSEGDAAEQARASLVRLDIDRNPGNYVERRCDPGEGGNLVVSVRNATPLPLRNVVISVAYGQARQLERRLAGTLDPGEIARVDTGLGP
ncbi:MAG: hypothetical protein U5K76_10795 [Woeseiaceae bacterium]|nr:hypothetical protein [Woeseiaceae bacterium]